MPDANHGKTAAPRNPRQSVLPAPGAEWTRPGNLEPLFGIGRKLAYILADRGEIELVSLKPAGARRGVALVNLPSVRAFIERRRKKPASIATGTIGGPP